MAKRQSFKTNLKATFPDHHNSSHHQPTIPRNILTIKQVPQAIESSSIISDMEQKKVYFQATLNFV